MSVSRDVIISQVVRKRRSASCSPSYKDPLRRSRVNPNVKQTPTTISPLAERDRAIWPTYSRPAWPGHLIPMPIDSPNCARTGGPPAYRVASHSGHRGFSSRQAVRQHLVNTTWLAYVFLPSFHTTRERLPRQTSRALSRIRCFGQWPVDCLSFLVTEEACEVGWLKRFIVCIWTPAADPFRKRGNFCKACVLPNRDGGGLPRARHATFVFTILALLRASPKSHFRGPGQWY
jgi:hypothetical protein